MRLILNPRRSQRVAARLRVRVEHAGGESQAETEDVGPGGCLLVSPLPLEVGAWLRLAIDGGRLREKLLVAGRVAWASRVEPYRAGVAFVPMQEQGGQDPAAWFQRLVQATPGMHLLLRHVPDRLSLDTPLFLLPPPRFIVDFTSEELAVVGRVHNGMTVEELLARIEGEKKYEGRMIFALLARRALTLAPQEAGDPADWRPLLEQAGVPWEPDAPGDVSEAAFPLEGLALEPEVPAAQPLPQDPLRPSPAAPPDLEPLAAAANPPAAAAGPPVAASSAPVGAPRGGRSPAAQALFESGLAAVEAGDIRGGIVLLRKALAASPRDSQIAAAIGALAFKDRQVPQE
ncbi:MAG TPA: PilZ domain-containing protein [Anaeromyxobacteraceae bacterium]|nr:PilZ domain-containing protein [Anaeromyxobacteraceae bacterium]